MSRFLSQPSPWAKPEQLPLRSVQSILRRNPCGIAADSALVVAPHPDDETLGCGGAIALLRGLGCTVRILVISDGTKSHPNSRKYPATVLRNLRESETRSAMAMLGVSSPDITFLRLLDGSVSEAGEQAIDCCQIYLSKVAPRLIFLPWRNDPHPDHRATWELINQAIPVLPQPPRILEYPIWDWDTQQQGEFPIGVRAWRLDISPVAALKQRAIDVYRSQTTNLIDDDPQGFCLTAEMLAKFDRPWEVYFKVVSQ